MNTTTPTRSALALKSALAAAVLVLLAVTFNAQAAPRVVPVDANPFGRSYEEWAVDWWRWVMSIPADENPLLTGNCSTPQEGNVQFIAGSFGSGITHCDVPVGKGIFFPVSGFLNDWPCPDPDFKPAPGQSLEDFLIETVQPYIALIEEATLSIDGQPAKSMLGQRVTSGLFTFTGDPSLASSIDPCITGEPQAAIVDGYYVMVVGLGPGVHTLHVTVNFGGTLIEVTSAVNVVGR